MKCIDVEELSSMYFPGAGEVLEWNTEHASFLPKGEKSTLMYICKFMFVETPRETMLTMIGSCRGETRDKRGCGLHSKID